MIALKSALERGTIGSERFQELLHELDRIPEKVKEALEADQQIRTIAAKYKDAHSFLFLGRRYGLPVALEGALKLKEIYYIHAEGYPASQMKHGHIALVDEIRPQIGLTTCRKRVDKTG